MSQGGRCRKPLGEQQDFIGRLPFGEFFNRAPLVKQARRRADDIFADRFEQKVDRLGHTGVFRPDRHHERARFLDNSARTPIFIRLAMGHRGVRIEMAAHGLDVFLPGIIMQDKITEARMSFKNQAEHVLRFALMPVHRVNKFYDAGESFFRRAASEPKHGPSPLHARHKKRNVIAIRSRLLQRSNRQN